MATFVPFDNGIVLRKVVIRPSHALVMAGEERNVADPANQVMQVIAVGPGRRLDDPAGILAANGDPNLVPRAPMNVKVGDIVFVAQAIRVQLEGPLDEVIFIAHDNLVIGRVEGLNVVDSARDPAPNHC